MRPLVHRTDDARRRLIGAMRHVATAGATRPFIGEEAALVRSMAETVGPRDPWTGAAR